MNLTLLLITLSFSSLYFGHPSLDHLFGLWAHLPPSPVRHLICILLLFESHRLSSRFIARTVFERGLEIVLEGRVDGPDGTRALVQEIC